MDIFTLIIYKWLDLAVFRVQNRPIWMKVHWKDILEGIFITHLNFQLQCTSSQGSQVR